MTTDPYSLRALREIEGVLSEPPSPADLATAGEHGALFRALAEREQQQQIEWACLSRLRRRLIGWAAVLVVWTVALLVGWAALLLLVRPWEGR